MADVTLPAELHQSQFAYQSVHCQQQHDGDICWQAGGEFAPEKPSMRAMSCSTSGGCPRSKYVVSSLTTMRRSTLVSSSLFSSLMRFIVSAAGGETFSVGERGAGHASIPMQ